ncbi:MAG: hypothetical protein ACOYKE_03510 [Ferruginibacter sp.]
MKTAFIFFSLVLCISIVHAQSNLLTQVGTGQLYLKTQSNEFDGSPFLIENPVLGNVKLSFGKTYDNLQLLFDAYNNRVYYFEKDSIYQLIDVVVEFSLIEKNVTRQFKRIPADVKLLDGKFVEVLTEGKITIVHYHSKKLEESAVYGGTAKKSMIDLKETYFISNGKWKVAHYGLSNLNELTSDQQTALQAFLDKEKLNVKKEKGFIAAIQYYNSLFQ